jgi:16S rRNA (cytosine1402-N4)-methyltransferase
MSIKEQPPQSMADDTSKVSDAPVHIPVLLEATVQQLDPKEGENYLDLTAGYGGHARAILDKTHNFSDSVLVDRDDYAIQRLESFSKKGVQLVHTDFVTAAKQLIKEGRTFNMVLIDLGVSSPQLDQNERGFSFVHSGPLDMRMDRRQSRSAKTLVNTATVGELTRIITEYGEEPLGFANAIVKAIAKSRPLETTEQLATLIQETYRGRWKKIHPATRTFQALRIAVNDELKLIEDLLPLLPSLLKPGGRLGIISFHSLEDRLVKQYLKNEFDQGYEAELLPITKKAMAGKLYDVHNPRSRSSKLRVAVKK